MHLLTIYTVHFGRIPRRVWVARMAGMAVFFSAFGMLAEWAFGSAGAAMFALAFVWCGSAVSAQRLHDRGSSAWALLAVLVPVLGPLWLLWQLIRKGDDGANGYGSNPAVFADYLQVDISR